MFRDGKDLNNVCYWEQAIDLFFNWLREEYPKGVILVAHGAFASDAPLIIRDFQRSGWNDAQIEDTVVGFCDTLQAFPKYFPREKNPGKLYTDESII